MRGEIEQLYLCAGFPENVFGPVRPVDGDVLCGGIGVAENRKPAKPVAPVMDAEVIAVGQALGIAGKPADILDLAIIDARKTRGCPGERVAPDGIKLQGLADILVYPDIIRREEQPCKSRVQQFGQSCQQDEGNDVCLQDFDVFPRVFYSAGTSNCGGSWTVSWSSASLSVSHTRMS